MSSNSAGGIANAKLSRQKALDKYYLNPNCHWEFDNQLIKIQI